MFPQVLDTVPRRSLKYLVEEKTLLDATSGEGLGQGQVQVSVMFREEGQRHNPNQTLGAAYFPRVLFVYVVYHLARIYQYPSSYVIIVSWCIHPGLRPGPEGGRNTGLE